MAKHYAWTSFTTERNDYGQVTGKILPGDTVTQEKLDISNEEYDELLDIGAIREEPYPKGIPNDMSPNEYYAQQDAALDRGELDEETANTVRKRQAQQFEAQTDEETALVNSGGVVEEASNEKPPADK